MSVCENGSLNVWKLGKNGLEESTKTPFTSLKGHYTRTTLLKYHTLAKNIVASSDSSGVIKVWDLDASCEKFSCANLEQSHVI